MTQTTYNNGVAEERVKQLRDTKVEESQIQELSKIQFESLPKPVQEKAEHTGIRAGLSFFLFDEACFQN
jgi:hypothetical protein